MEQLVKSKTIHGKWFVRPISWAGSWDKKGNLACAIRYMSQTMNMIAILI